MIIKAIKNKLRTWLFKDFIESLDLQLQVKEAALESKYNEKIKNINITDLMYEKMSAFNPLNIQNEQDDILEYKVSIGEDTTFLTECRELFKNKSFHDILSWMEKVQLIHIAKEAEEIDKVNFGRAHISSYELLREDVARLNKIYLERHTTPENFDKHAIT